MNVAPVHVANLEVGKLPDVCIKTGTPTTRRVRSWWFVAPGWTFIGLLFGVFPYFLLRWLFGRRVEGLVPVSAGVIRRIERARQLRTTAVVIALVAIPLGFVGAGAVGSIAGLAILAVAAGAGVYGAVQWVGMIPGDDIDEVLLTRVSARFAHDLGRMVGEHRLPTSGPSSR